ncbi:mechanosensitive ion channel [Parerythrobacter jejuensis]|uniref:Small-conductance mechanosensitive channel n=1 Tax=Parerythrobacter jejuensis TaxID=795812 RepID=A0A845AV87_9SPHN|nr:mechanosensitive ion channel [Parerythrobacter jejuensis]MXP30447.1 mechanosensitive ion channel [Parerythrobacter jejuensis]MXP33207.1 mechanosensitive ion channel [Parerythrobacter jejuensis]
MRIGNYEFDQALAMELAEKAGLALLILVVTWALAKAAKWAFAHLVDRVSFLQKGTSSGGSVGESLGKIVSLLIWLFGLLGILQVLELNAVAGPINSLLENIMDFIPNLVGAGLLLFIGLMIAGIVRDIAITAMQTIDLDKWANKGGVDNVTGNNAISTTLGTIIYVLIAIPVAIGALGVLNIAAISGPASDMLRMILEAIPNIIAAAILLGLGYFISKFVVDLLKELLGGLGVDRALGETGLLPDGTAASSVIARIVQVAIILFFAIAATRMLGFPELTAILNEVLALGGKVAFGAVVIGAGFLIANLLAKLIGGASEGSTAATIVRWATIVLFTVMGLQYTEIGGMLPGNALLVFIIGASVAGALAFGLGGREWAARKLEEWDSKK